MAVHFHPLTISNIYHETPECVAISFDVPANLADVFTFQHGQNITLKANVNGEILRRSYSICTAPHEGRLQVAVKMVPGGKFSTYANQQLKAGDVLEVMPPTGKFGTPLLAGQSKQYVAFAAGSGITPILSITKAILHQEPDSQVTLVYSNRNKNSIAFFETLEALKNKYLTRFRLIHLLSREQTEAPINDGRIDAAKLSQLQALINYQRTQHFFICGPESMIFCVKDFLLQKGVKETAIHYELFAAPGQANAKAIHNTASPVTNNESASQVTIRLDGRSLSFPLASKGLSILDAALQQGADLPFACKGGVCCTCRAKVVTGSVSMDVNYALEKEEVAQGYVLTCQAHPTSDQVVIDFDLK